MDTRHMVHRLARPGIIAVRDTYQVRTADDLRVAALVEIATAAATLARTIVKFRHLDTTRIEELVPVASDCDVRAVLGRGRWLPTMTRHLAMTPTGESPYLAGLPPVLAIPTVAARRARRASAGNGQPALFTSGGGGR